MMGWGLSPLPWSDWVASSLQYHTALSRWPVLLRSD